MDGVGLAENRDSWWTVVSVHNMQGISWPA